MSESLKSKLDSFYKLEKDWDSYGGLPIGRGAIATARLVGTLMSELTVMPAQPVPTSNGGVALEWHNGEIDMSISFLPSGGLDSIYIGGESESFEYEVTENETVEIYGPVPQSAEGTGSNPV